MTRFLRTNHGYNDEFFGISFSICFLKMTRIGILRHYSLKNPDNDRRDSTIEWYLNRREKTTKRERENE